MLLTLNGTQPLIMHNVQAADPQNAFAKAAKEYTSKRKKTDDDLAELDRIKYMSGLYYDEVDGPILPAPNVFRSLIEGGTFTRSGKKIERGVIFLATHAPLVYGGPRDVDSLWGDGTTKFVDRRIVTVNRARIPGIRPVFPIWSAAFEIELDTEVIDLDEFLAIASRAGKVGVGDFRRFYGKYTIEVTE